MGFGEKVSRLNILFREKGGGKEVLTMSRKAPEYIKDIYAPLFLLLIYRH
jgi:hypothetical protein